MSPSNSLLSVMMQRKVVFQLQQALFCSEVKMAQANVVQSWINLQQNALVMVSFVEKSRA